MSKYISSGKNDPMNDPFVAGIHNMINHQRKVEFEQSNQLSLGELIDKLEKIPDEKGDKKVNYDFEYAFPTTLDSWRGIYAELALGWDYNGGSKDRVEEPTIQELLKELKSAIGKVFTGWKGGDFEMDEDTPIWVANPGNSGHTAIVDVLDEGWIVILKTEYIKENLCPHQPV